MAGGWTAVDNDAWSEMVVDMTALGVAWPEGLCMADLRFLAGEVRIGKRKRIPSYRKLMERWGQNEYRARSAMRSDWQDPRFQVPETSQKPRTILAKTSQLNEGEAGEPPETLAVSSQKPRKNLDTRGGEQPNNLTTQQDLVSPQAATGQPSTGSKKAARVIPSDLLDAYEAYRTASGIKKSTRVLTAYKGQGQKLWGIHKEVGADAVGLFRWLATSQDQKAVFYRDGKYAAETVKRHLDTLLDLVDAKPSRTPHNGNRASASASDTPGHMFMRAYSNARGQHPAWLDHVPSDERAHFLRSAQHCKGLVMLKTMGVHPLEKKRAVETFNQSFEATR